MTQHSSAVVRWPLARLLAMGAAGMSVAALPAPAAEPTEEMRTFARMFATLEARDLKGYCAAMHGAPYAGYLSRVCKSAIQNKLKKPEDCSQESIAQQVKADAGQCLAMRAGEFEKKVQRGAEASQSFVKQMTAQGVDGEKLLQEERAGRR
jgi:hypothetical protein